MPGKHIECRPTTLFYTVISFHNNIYFNGFCSEGAWQNAIKKKKGLQHLKRCIQEQEQNDGREWDCL